MNLRPIFYDTETTGLNTSKDHIIEIAAHDPVRKKSFEKLSNPKCPIPQESTAICHITDDMVADADDFSVVGQEFIDFCDGNVVLIAHNNDNFDLPIIKNSFKRHDLNMPAEWQFLDTLKWARKYRPDLPKHTLQFLRETYGIPANTAHRALDDTIILYQLFKAMTNGLSIEEICKLMSNAKPTSINTMPFGKYRGWPLEKIPKTYVKWLAKNEVFDKPDNKPLLDEFKKLGSIPS